MSGRSRILLISWALLVCAGQHLQAQNPFEGLSQDWRWRWFGTELGAPAGPVLKIMETSGGEMWIHTGAGLAWYDGYRWNSPPIDTLGPHFNRAQMLSDSMGVLLVVPPSLFRVTHDGYTRMPLWCGGVEVPIRNAVNLPGRGMLMQGDTVLYLLQRNTMSRFPSPYEHPLTAGVSEHPFRIYPSSAGNAILNAATGVYRLENLQWKKLAGVEGHSPVPTYVAEDSRGNGIFTAQVGVRFERWEWDAQGSVQRTRLEPGQLVPSIAIHPDGSLLAVESSGDILTRIRSVWRRVSPIPPHLLTSVAITFDSHGDLWVGKTNGVFLCNLSSKTWRTLSYADNAKSNSINELLIARDGILWVGSSNGVRLYRDTSLIRIVREINGTALGVVTGLAQDSRGNIWISSGASFGGAFCGDGRTWRHYGRREGFTDNNVHRIMPDRHGDLWFMTISPLAPGISQEREDGAYRYDGERFTRLDQHNGLPHGRVYAMAQDSGGAYWFATLKGLARKRGNEWKYWDASHGLHTSRVFAVAVDHANRLWFGHQRNGLGYIDENDAPVYVSSTDGFSPLTVWDFHVDYAGRLWVATREGLGVHDRGNWALFTNREGLMNPNLWPLTMKGKDLYIGTSHSGVAVLAVSELEVPPPLVRISDPVQRGNTVSLAWQALAPRGFIPSAEVRTRYRVDRGAWSVWGETRTASIDEPSIGDHTVEIQALGMLAQVDTTPQALSFSVPPPLFLRPMVLLPIGALTILLMSLALNLNRKKREHTTQLRALDARYRAVVDQQSELIVRTLPDGRLSFVNEAVCRMLQRSRQDLTGRPLASVFQPLYGESTLAALHGSPASSFPREVDADCRAHDGTERCIRWIAEAVLNEGGDVLELQMVGRDITERKRAERELINSEERYRIVAEQTGQLVYDYDVSSGSIAWYGAITDVTGYSTEEFQSVSIGRWEEMIHPEDREHATQVLDQAMVSRSRYEIEYRFRRKDGSYIDVFDNGVFLVGPSGTVDRMLGTMTDITARKQNEALVATSLKEKEVLLKEIHHRVKNNLQVISSLLNLQSGAVSDQRALEQLRESQHRIRSMALIHERLYQSRNLASIEFDEYVKSLCSYLIRSYNPQCVRLEINIGRISLPINAAIPCGLIINELVSNALKYAFKGGNEGTIDVGMELTADKKAILTVRDTGVGFPAGLDFRQTQTLGMQLVNTLTAQINGTIALNRNGGTTFSITFPLEM
ncbi:MAG: PAS domain-containing protein [Bacteroidetes bacterium]|nr:PAS domain-containing protein [Bacteroidota bacterium]